MATLYVCTTCRREGADPDAIRDGAALIGALETIGAPDGLRIEGVECLSACSNACSIALADTGKWTYVFGRMTAENAADILAGAAKYAASADGVVPWRERPEIFRKQSLARIPPQE